jgi:hypothetical protein
MTKTGPTSLSALAEQLCRIEHKLDLILEGLAKNIPSMPIRPMNSEHNFDPITGIQVRYNIDIVHGHVVRVTEFPNGTGLLPINIQPMPEQSKGSRNGEGSGEV